MANLRGDPIGAVLEAVSLSLGAQADLHAAAVADLRAPSAAAPVPDVPMDEELRAQIVASFDRQVRKEAVARLNLAAANPNARRDLVLACAGAALASALALAVAFSAGSSYGGDARIAEVCRGDAVSKQAGGLICSFWLQRPPPPAKP